MLELLGWSIAKSEEKRLMFARRFVSLGVQLDFSRTKEKVIVVSNKPGRLNSILELVAAIISKGSLGFKEALSLKGKIAFSEGQLFGRVAAPLCRLLSKWASDPIERKLDDALVEALGLVTGSLCRAGPKVVMPISFEAPVLIFTDGACEPEGTTIGGAIFIPGLQPECFGAKISDEVVQSWCTKVGQTQVIGQAEIHPVLIARHTWGPLLRNRKVLYFIDNDSARLSLIKAYSPVLPSLSIIMKCAAWDNENGSISWYARVPTSSNIADDPSRFDASFLRVKYGAKLVRPCYNGPWPFTDILE
jgi:hypothetical protein